MARVYCLALKTFSNLPLGVHLSSLLVVVCCCLSLQTAAKDNRRKRKEFVRQLEEEVRRSNARNLVLQRQLDTLAQENK